MRAAMTQTAPVVVSILTVLLTTTRAQARELAPTTSYERGQNPAFTRASQNVATAATLLDTLPPPSTDGVDMLHR
jgi:hypothetical protein